MAAINWSREQIYWIQKWRDNNEFFFKKLSNNEREVITNCLVKYKYGGSGVSAILNRIRMKWMEYNNRKHFKEGQWLVHDINSLEPDYFVRFPKEGEYTSNGFFAGSYGDDWSVSHEMFSKCRIATLSEITARLTNEAKRRGIRIGETDYIEGLEDTRHSNFPVERIVYHAGADALLTDVHCILYRQGQWSKEIYETT